MSGYTIKRWFALHDERTKYYQVFLVESETSPVAYVVTHWGSYDVGAVHYPANMGQCKVKRVKKAEGQWEASRARDAKKNRGYRFEGQSVDEFLGFEIGKFRNRLTQIFKDKDAIDMHVTLTDSLASSMSTPVMEEASEADLAHLFGTDREPTPKPKKEEKHAEWGSW